MSSNIWLSYCAFMKLEYSGSRMPAGCAASSHCTILPSLQQSQERIYYSSHTAFVAHSLQLLRVRLMGQITAGCIYLVSRGSDGEYTAESWAHGCSFVAYFNRNGLAALNCAHLVSRASDGEYTADANALSCYQSNFKSLHSATSQSSPLEIRTLNPKPKP